MRVLRTDRAGAPAAALVAALTLWLAPVAQGDVGGQIISRCLHGQSLSGFKQADYRKALKELSATSEEYSDCAAMIRAAQTAAASSHNGSGGGGGPSQQAPAGVIAATPTEQRALAAAAKTRPGQINLGGGETVHPGVIHANVGSAFSKLPGPLLALLGVALGCVVAGAAAMIQKRLRGRGAD